MQIDESRSLERYRVFFCYCCATLRCARKSCDILRQIAVSSCGFPVLRRDDNINRRKCNFLHDVAHVKRTTGQTLRGKHCESIASPTFSIIFHALARGCHHHCIRLRNARIYAHARARAHTHTHTHIYILYVYEFWEFDGRDERSCWEPVLVLY